MNRFLFDVATHSIAVYVGAGIFGATLMSTAIPALNVWGKIWMVFNWPQMVICAPVDSGCDPMPPEWLNPYIFDIEKVEKNQ